MSPACEAWTVVALGVGVFDVWALRTDHRSMSEAFKEAFRCHPALVGVGWAVLTAHLIGVLPSQVDPFKRVAHLIGRFLP